MAQKDQDIGTANAYFSFPLENLPRIRQFESYWAWIKSIFVTNFETIEEICGKDSKIYLQFQIHPMITWGQKYNSTFCRNNHVRFKIIQT